IRHIQAQLLQPDNGFGVARGTPIASRRQRTAGTDLGAVGNGRALELAEFEEPIDKDFQPLLDLAQVVLAALLWSEQVRPDPGLLVFPGLVRQISDLTGPKTISCYVE